MTPYFQTRKSLQNSQINYRYVMRNYRYGMTATRDYFYIYFGPLFSKGMVYVTFLWYLQNNISWNLCRKKVAQTEYVNSRQWQPCGGPRKICPRILNIKRERNRKMAITKTWLSGFQNHLRLFLYSFCTRVAALAFFLFLNFTFTSEITKEEYLA